MKEVITIQLKKDEIWIRISEEASESEILECLELKLIELEKLYNGDTTPIKVTGKLLTNKEIEEVEELIKSRINVKVEFESPTTLGLYGIKKGFHQEIKTSDTIFIKGSLRSGQRIEHEGSVVVVGDLKAGAEIIAAENIVILGELKGLAHAGAKGNRNATIAANRIDCPQIRIADKIKEFEKQELSQNIYTYTYVNDKDEIIVE